MAGVSTTTDIAASVGGTIGSPAMAETIVVYKWDAATQTQSSYQVFWDGGNWIDFGVNSGVSTSDPLVIAVPSAADGNTWIP
jgi:hypothetical protein